MPPPDLLAELRRTLAASGEVRLAILFGSRARGTAHAGSDLDLAVDAPGADLLDVGARLSLALDCEVDVLSLADPGVPLLEALLRDGIVVYEGNAGAGARWRSHALTSLETDRPWFSRMQEAWLKRVAERGIARG